MLLYSIGSYEVLYYCNYLIVREKRKYLKSSMKPNLGLFILNIWVGGGGGGGGLIETGGLFYLAKTMVLVLHKELECNWSGKAHVQ